MAELLSEFKVGYAKSSPITWAKIPGLRQCTPPSVETEAVDITAFGDQYATTRPGLRRLRAMTFRARLDPGAAWYDDLRDGVDDQGLYYWRLEYAANDARTEWMGIEFQGRVASANPVGNEPGRLLEVEVTVMPVPPLYEDGPGASQLG
jgi:hypothetical protein